MSDAAFAFARVSDGEQPFLAVVQGDAVYRLGALLAGIDESGDLGQLFADWDRHVEAIASALADGAQAAPALGNGLTRLVPVAPRQVFLAGMNYRSHVIQLMVDQGTGSRPDMTEDEIREEAAQMMDARAASGVPFVFTGLPSSICGPDDDIRLRHDSEQSDWELELAAVIGRRTRNVSREQALDHVAGWTIVNDLTCRDLIRRTDAGPMGVDFLRGKMSPTYKPVGPNVVPAAFVTDPQDLQITLRLNGETLQDESTRDMVFDVASLIAYASEQAEILPGDLVLTGSPAGNGTHYGRFLRDGDQIEAEITGLGTQRNRCVAAA
ncbi:MAG: fumarylacetoacetate hydrolase family protein [Solirubrobacteraceae bacterium]